MLDTSFLWHRLAAMKVLGIEFWDRRRGDWSKFFFKNYYVLWFFAKDCNCVEKINLANFKGSLIRVFCCLGKHCTQFTPPPSFTGFTNNDHIVIDVKSRQFSLSLRPVQTSWTAHSISFEQLSWHRPYVSLGFHARSVATPNFRV